MKISLIDIGTQSLKHYIFEVNGTEKSLIHYKRYSEANLGESMVISTATIERNLSILSDCISQNKKEGVFETQLLGTDILRKAENADIFIARVKELFNLEIQIVTHTEEARYLYEGFLNIVPKDFYFGAANIGGGSTEVVVCDAGKLIEEKKIPFGVKYLRNTFTEDGVMNWEKTEEYLNSEISFTETAPVIFVTGVVLSSLDNVAKSIGTNFDKGSFPRHPIEAPIEMYSDFVNKIKRIPTKELEPFYSHDPSYALNVGLSHVVYCAIAKKLGVKKVILSNNDMTDGVIYEIANKNKSDN